VDPAGANKYMKILNKLNSLGFQLCILAILLGCSEKGEVMATETNDDNLIIEMPVHGIWITPNTPGSKVPSHGTTDFGESYAIDFVMLNDAKGIKKPYKSSIIKYIVSGVPLSDFYGWGQTVYSPINGKVVAIENNIAERETVNPFSDLQYMRKATKEYISSRKFPEKIAGNYVLLKISNTEYALLAHLVKGSIIVKPGESVETGQAIGKLGHSGNSTMPHLHMQFMNSDDFNIAEGILFKIKEYEVIKDGKWKKVNNSIPMDKDIIRY